MTDDVSADRPRPWLRDLGYRQLIEGSNAMFFILDREGAFVYVNDSVEPMLGWEPSSLIGRNAFDLISPDTLDDAIGAFGDLFGRQTLQVVWDSPPLLVKFARPDGTYVAVEVVATADDAVGEVSGTVFRSEFRYATEQFADRLARFRPTDELLAVIVNMLKGESTLSLSAVSYDWSDGAFAHVVGDLPPLLAGGSDGERPAFQGPWVEALDRQAPVFVDTPSLPPLLREFATSRGLAACWAQPIDRAFAPTGACIVMWRIQSPVQVYMHRTMLRRASSQVALAYERQTHDAALEHALSHDPLTGVGNRALFFDRLGQHLDASPDGASLFLVAVDHMKMVNDTPGVATGDLLLKRLAARLDATLEPNDLLCRIGGDIYAILFHERLGADRVEARAQQVLHEARRPITLDTSGTIRATVSVGVASTYDNGCSRDELADAADQALALAKGSGRNTWRLALT